MRNILLMGTLLLAMGCSDKTEEPAKTTSTQTNFVAKTPQEKELLRVCVNGAQQSDKSVSQSDANKSCLCILAGIREQYSVAQLQALDTASDAERMRFDKHIDKVSMVCREKFKAGQL